MLLFFMQENHFNLSQTKLTNCYSRICICSKVSILYFCPSTINANLIELKKNNM